MKGNVGCNHLDCCGECHKKAVVLEEQIKVMRNTLMRNTLMKVKDFGHITILPAENGVIVRVGPGEGVSTKLEYVFTNIEELFEWISQTVLEKEEA